MKSNAVKTKTTHTSPASFRNPSAPFFQKNRPAAARYASLTHGIQAQPRFNKAQDPFEKEADAVADQVVAGRSAAPINGQGRSSGGELIHLITPLTIARKEEKRKEEPVQPQVEEEETPLQARAGQGEKGKERETVKAKTEEKGALQTRSESDMTPEKKKEEKQDRLQRQADEEEEALQAQPEEEEDVQKQSEEEEEALQAKAEDEEEEPIQRRAAGPLPRFNPVSLKSRLSASKGRGSPLPEAARTRMEKSFAADFGGIRIHTDDNAVDLSRRLRAQAFTHGRDIYFNRDKFSPDSRQGTHLLAHELTHTVQQGKAFPKPVAKVQTAAEKEPEEELDGQAAADTAAVTSPPLRIQRSFLDSVTGAAGALWDATTGQLVDAAGQVISMTSEMFWSLLETMAPAFVPIVREISAKGILGFLKEKISRALNHIFDGLQNNNTVLGPLFSMYVEMVAQAAEIVLALASGDCKPLFAAVNRLKDMLSKMAGDAWNAVTDFFAPVGAFFSNLWQSFGAPVLDWLKQTAADVWNYISGLGQQIWAWTQPFRDAVGGAWNWVKDKLGLGDEAAEGDSEGGLIKWIQGKAEQVWGAVKEELQPVIAPIQAVVEKVQAVLSLDAIFNLRETVQGWLSKAEAMGQAMGEDGSNVAAEQTSLRDEILPAIMAFIESLRLSIIDTGLWISDKIGAVVSTVSGFIDSLMSSPLVSGLQAAVMWIKTALLQLTDWYRTSVAAVFNLVGDGLVTLSSFIRPILDILNQIVETLKNLMGKLPDLILGPVWWLLPDCIKNPIKDFILNQVLMRIPFFQQFMSLGDIWAKVKDTALTILKQIFVDGNLFGALWTYFKAVLGLFGLPPQLITNIIVKAAQALGDIIANPIGFIINILKAVKEGFVRFFANILKHLFGGVTDWLFGQIAEAGITIPKDFSLKSILGLVFEILGLTMEKIWKKLADKIGQDKVDKLKEGIERATGAWEWIKLAATDPAAIWEKVKEKLSDLWTAVITGVVGWINSVIIVQGTKWLLSLLDVSGIMPTITATIALYKAIESFFAYLKEMLEIVNTAMNGIADMAKGAIGTAAGFLESALAKSVPIIIGFLANQFGLGRLGSKLREIIGAVQEKVDGAIDWLIEKAVNMGKGFLEMLKSGAVAVKEGVLGLVQWWKKKRKITLDSGEEHTLLFQGEGPSSMLSVKSEIMTINKIVEKRKARKPELIPTQTTHLDDAVTKAEQLRLFTKNEDVRDETLFNQHIDDELKAIGTSLKEGTAFAGEKSLEELPLTNVTFKPLGKQAGEVVAFPLTLREGNTRGTKADNSVIHEWKLHTANVSPAEQSRSKAAGEQPATQWNAVHLLSALLHGPGEDWKNLAPGTNKVNRGKLGIHEEDAKREIGEEKILLYRTKVEYRKDAPFFPLYFQSWRQQYEPDAENALHPVGTLHDTDQLTDETPPQITVTPLELALSKISDDYQPIVKSLLLDLWYYRRERIVSSDLGDDRSKKDVRGGILKILVGHNVLVAQGKTRGTYYEEGENLWFGDQGVNVSGHEVSGHEVSGHGVDDG